MLKNEIEVTVSSLIEPTQFLTKAHSNVTVIMYYFPKGLSNFIAKPRFTLDPLKVKPFNSDL